MAVVELLTERAPRLRLDRIEAPVGDSDPYGIDVQLTLYVCYELHHRGFAGVDPGWEWNPGLLHLRARLEDTFLGAVRRDVGDVEADAAEELARLSLEPDGTAGPSHHLRSHGTWEQLREYFVHRSLDHPRLNRQSKACFGPVEFAVFGDARGGRTYQQSFADLMVAAGLDPAHLAYVDVVPAESLAAVNLMSLFGLHRSYRGAAVGHFAASEITSTREAHRLLDALVRLHAPRLCCHLYREHVEADAVHGQMVHAEAIGDLINREAVLESDVVFGMRAFSLIENRLGHRLMGCWRAGRTSLRRPLS